MAGRREDSEYELPPDVSFTQDNVSIGKQVMNLLDVALFGKSSAGSERDGSSRAGALFFSNKRKSNGAEDSTNTNLSRSTRSRMLRSRTIAYVPEVDYVISPSNKIYLIWEQWILLMALVSVLLTPVEFGFYRRLPNSILVTEMLNNMFFIVDIVVTFFVAYKDPKTFNMVEKHKDIALRYLRTTFLLDLLACIPWDLFYRAAGQSGGAEVIRWFMWSRLIRAYRIDHFFDKLERDVRFSYYGARIFRLLSVEYFVTHVAGCFFYYLATTVPAEEEGGTWMGSLTLGDFSYENFRELDLGNRYVTSVYWAIVTMATVGYGDIHAVNVREMIFSIVFISFDMVLSAYLVGNITALIVKGSETEKFRDRMSALVQYMHRKKIPGEIRKEMREHVRLQFEAEQVDDEVIEDFPATLRLRVALALYREVVSDCFLFKNCSREFVEQIISCSRSEIFMPLEVVVQQRGTGDFMYIVCSGQLEEVMIDSEGTEIMLGEVYPSQTIGEAALLCNIPQPYSVRVKDLAELLRVDRQALSSVMLTFVGDSRKVVDNLLQRSNEENSALAHLTGDITKVIEQREAELVMNTITAASRGDIEHLKHLLRLGAKVNLPDYDGRTALHLAAARGLVDIVKFLLEEGADVNAKDNYGVTALQECLRSGHEDVAQVLVQSGGEVNLQEAGTELCNAVIRGNVALLQRLIDNGVDPNSADYDLRTPLHIACAEGFLLIAKTLVEHGADVFSKDRWGNTPLEEAQRCGSQPVVNLIEEAMLKKLGGKFNSAGGTAGTAVPAGDPATRTTLSLVAAAVSESAANQKAEQEKEDKEAVQKDVVGDLAVHGASLGRVGGSQLATVKSGATSGIPSPARSFGGSPRGAYQRKPRSGGLLSGGLARKRITIYPYHPWVPARRAGRLIFLPGSIEDLVQLASQQFGTKYTRVLNGDGGEIASMDLVLDGDRLYFADDVDPEQSENARLLA